MLPPEHQETTVPWFDAKVGIEWLNAMMQAIQSDTAAVPQAEELLDDFAMCKKALARAEATGAKWHFRMDI